MYEIEIAEVKFELSPIGGYDVHIYHLQDGELEGYEDVHVQFHARHLEDVLTMVRRYAETGRPCASVCENCIQNECVGCEYREEVNHG